MHPITQLVEKLIRGMCRLDVEIEEQDSGSELTIFVRPSQTDFGPVCGRQGRVIRALNWMVTEAGRHHGMAAGVKLVNSWESFETKSGHKEFVPNNRFDLEALKRLVHDWIRFLTDSKPTFVVRPQPPTLLIGGIEKEVIDALDEVFFPYCMNQGVKLKIKPYEGKSLGTRSLLGDERIRKGGVSS